MHQLDRIEEKLDKVIAYFEERSVSPEELEEEKVTTWPAGLTENQVKAIQKDWEGGYHTQYTLAELYNVSQATISRVCNGVTTEQRRNKG